MGTTGVQHGHNRGTTGVQHGCNMGTTGVQQGYNMGTTWVQHGYNMGTTWGTTWGTTGVQHGYNMYSPSSSAPATSVNSCNAGVLLVSSSSSSPWSKGPSMAYQQCVNKSKQVRLNQSNCTLNRTTLLGEQYYWGNNIIGGTTLLGEQHYWGNNIIGGTTIRTKT
jgi:hypothetical protein